MTIRRQTSKTKTDDTMIQRKIKFENQCKDTKETKTSNLQKATTKTLTGRRISKGSLLAVPLVITHVALCLNLRQ